MTPQRCPAPTSFWRDSSLYSIRTVAWHGLNSVRGKKTAAISAHTLSDCNRKGGITSPCQPSQHPGYTDSWHFALVGEEQLLAERTKDWNQVTPHLPNDRTAELQLSRQGHPIGLHTSLVEENVAQTHLHLATLQAWQT